MRKLRISWKKMWKFSSCKNSEDIYSALLHTWYMSPSAEVLQFWFSRLQAYLAYLSIQVLITSVCLYEVPCLCKNALPNLPHISYRLINTCVFSLSICTYRSLHDQSYLKTTIVFYPNAIRVLHPVADRATFSYANIWIAHAVFQGGNCHDGGRRKWRPMPVYFKMVATANFRVTFPQTRRENYDRYPHCITFHIRMMAPIFFADA